MEPAILRRELYISRIYDASRTQLFRAWTEARQLSRWWGPKDFTNPVCEVDARVGGRLRITMRAPDGTEYPMQAVFTELRAPERLAFDFEALDGAGKPVLTGRLSVGFADEGGRTRLSLSTTAEGTGADAAMKLDGMETGWNQSLDRFSVIVMKL